MAEENVAVQTGIRGVNWNQGIFLLVVVMKVTHPVLRVISMQLKEYL